MKPNARITLAYLLLVLPLTSMILADSVWAQDTETEAADEVDPREQKDLARFGAAFDEKLERAKKDKSLRKKMLREYLKERETATHKTQLFLDAGKKLEAIATTDDVGVLLEYKNNACTIQSVPGNLVGALSRLYENEQRLAAREQIARTLRETPKPEAQKAMLDLGIYDQVADKDSITFRGDLEIVKLGDLAEVYCDQVPEKIRRQFETEDGCSAKYGYSARQQAWVVLRTNEANDEVEDLTYYSADRQKRSRPVSFATSLACSTANSAANLKAKRLQSEADPFENYKVLGIRYRYTNVVELTKENLWPRMRKAPKKFANRIAEEIRARARGYRSAAESSTRIWGLPGNAVAAIPEPEGERMIVLYQAGPEIYKQIFDASESGVLEALQVMDLNKNGLPEILVREKTKEKIISSRLYQFRGRRFVEVGPRDLPLPSPSPTPAQLPGQSPEPSPSAGSTTPAPSPKP